MAIVKPLLRHYTSKSKSSWKNIDNNLINLYYMSRNYELALKFIDQAEASGVKLNAELKKAVLKALGK